MFDKVPNRPLQILFIYFYLFQFLISINLKEKIITNSQFNSTSFTKYNFVISE